MKAWLFQHTPDNYEASVGRVDSVIRWKATRYFRDMQPGDIVHYWMSGEKGGLTGWGLIAGPAERQLTKTGDGDRRVPVRTQAAYPSPIPRDQVQGLESMADFRLFGSGFGPVGTNFRLSPPQAEELFKLIAEGGHELPPVEGLEPHSDEQAADIWPGLATTRLNVRSGPDTSFEVQTVLEEGEPVLVLEQEGEWLRISGQDGNVLGFVAAQFITRASQDSPVQIDQEIIPPVAAQPEIRLLFSISQYNPVDDYHTLAQNTGGGFVRATAGINKDDDFDHNWMETKAAGSPRGAYHVWDPDEDPVEQAYFFTETVMSAASQDPPDMGELPPVLDIEKDGDPFEVKALVETVKRRFNTQPIIYTRAGIWDQLGPTPWAADYPLWIAQYPQGLDVSRLNTDLRRKLSEIQPDLPGAWADSGWTLWQFTDQGNGPEYGINQSYESIHLTAFRGTQADLLALSPPHTPVEKGQPAPLFTIPERASFDSDSPGVVDSLKFSNYVEGFARLIADKKVNLPLAIGLFGNWGVGKTHFINMLRKEIEALVQHSEEAPGSRKYVPWIKQITFNAWHYIDTNLWASLATAIFDELAYAIQPEEKDYEKKRRELRARLDSSTQLRNQAEERKNSAREKRGAAEEKLKAAREEREKKQKALNTAWLKKILSKEEQDEFREAMEKVAGQFGFDPVVETMDDAAALANDFRDLGARSTALWRALVSHFSSWPKTFRALGVLILAVAAIAMFPGLLLWLWERLNLPDLPAFLSQSLDWVLQLSAGVSGVLGWAGSKMSTLKSGVEKFEQMEKKIQEVESRLGQGQASGAFDGDPVLSELAGEIARLDAEIEDAEQVIENTTQVIEEAQVELRRINMGGLVYDFARSRTQDPRYLENLGLISVIHQDMKYLQDLIEDWDRGEAEAAEANEQNAASPAGAEVKEKDPTHRIVLYIDDLDRCPLDKVVEVLQAVHLLLAFELFVVVVAVDPRWLERSLYKAYVPEALEAEGAQNGEHPEKNFSAQNYLEKIFQIPFSIPKMDHTGFQQMVDDLVETRSEEAERLRARQEEEAVPVLPVDEGGGDGKPGAGGAAGPSTGPVVPAPTNGAAGGEAPPTGGAPGPEPAGTDGDGLPEGEKSAEAGTNAAAPREVETPVLLEDHEEAALKLLFPFVKTPRLTKRLLNIYRLIRFQEGFDSGQFEKFVDRDGGRYIVAMLILALNTGFPQVSGLLLPLLQGPTVPADWNSFLTDLEKAVTHFAGTGGGDAEGEAGASEVAYKLPAWLDERTARRFDREALVDMLVAYGSFLQQAAKLDPPLVVPGDITLYRRWAAQAGRFSFHWHIS